MYFKDHLNVKRQNFDYFEGLELVFENSRVFKKHINPVLYVKIYLLCTRNVAQCMPHFVNVQDSIFLYFTINIKNIKHCPCHSPVFTSILPYLDGKTLYSKELARPEIRKATSFFLVFSLPFP